MPKRTTNPAYLKARQHLLADNPPCHWCGGKATEADHLIEHDQGGTDDLDNLVPSCKPCNSKRGAIYVNNKTKQRVKARQTFFDTTTMPDRKSVV